MDGALPASLIEEIIKSGVLGSIIAAAGWYIIRQNRVIGALMTVVKEVQEKRTSDAQMVTDKVLGITDKWHNIVSELKHLVEQQGHTMEDLHEAIDKVLERGRR